MKHFLLATVFALAMTTGAAMAQTTTETQTTTTVTPALVAPAPLLVAPPVGTLSSTTTKKTIAPDGTETDKTETTYRNTDGVADDTMTRTTTIAPPVATQTTNTYSSTTVIEQVPVASCPPNTKYDLVFQTCEKVIR
jgi:hypothetical protein